MYKYKYIPQILPNEITSTKTCCFQFNQEPRALCHFVVEDIIMIKNTLSEETLAFIFCLLSQQTDEKDICIFFLNFYLWSTFDCTQKDKNILVIQKKLH